MSKRKTGRPLSKVSETIRSLKVGEEVIVKEKKKYRIRGAVYYAQRSLGVRLVCNRIEGGFKITRKRKARAA